MAALATRRPIVELRRVPERYATKAPINDDTPARRAINHRFPTLVRSRDASAGREKLS